MARTHAPRSVAVRTGGGLAALILVLSLLRLILRLMSD